MNYLRADGIVLPSDDEDRVHRSDTDSGNFSASDDADSEDDNATDVAYGWRNIHDAVKVTIVNLGGKVFSTLR